MRSFITGGAGFIGSNLVDRLLGDGHEAFIVVVSAPLGERLVLEMKGCDAGALEGARRGLRIKRIAVAGVGIGDNRSVDGVRHRRETIGDGGHRQ